MSVLVSGVFWLVKCFAVLENESNFFLLPFPTLLLAASPFSPLSPVGKGHAGNMKPNRGEKCYIDFFFFCRLLSAPDGVFRFLLFHASSSLFFYLPRLRLSAITSHKSLHVCFWWGLRRSWLFIKGNKVCETERVSVCFCVFFFRAMPQLTCTWWPRTQKILPIPPMNWR